MKLIQISNSTSIVAIGFNAEKSTIVIQYERTGMYQYNSCTEDEFQQILLAKSVGKKAIEVLKGKKYKKLID